MYGANIDNLQYQHNNDNLKEKQDNMVAKVSRERRWMKNTNGIEWVLD